MTDRRQRQKEARAAKRKAEKKAEQRKEFRRRLVGSVVFGVAVVAVIVLATVAGRGDRSADAYASFREQPTACGAAVPAPVQAMSFAAPEPQSDITPSSTVTATLGTSCGDIVIELDPAGYPETADSFVFLARQGFFNGQVFHRIYGDLWVQGGDPNADGTGGPGYVVADERPDDGFVYEPGVVAMANRGRRTTGSQFFIVVSERGTSLTRNFNILGRVVSGQEALDRMLAVETVNRPGSAERSLPLETVYIESVTIEVSGP